MNFSTKPSFLLLCAGILSACATTNTDKDFLCTAQQGSPCTTIAAVDGTGSVPASPVTERLEDTLTDQLSQEDLKTGKTTAARGAMKDGGHSYNAARYRVPEQVGTLWIAPFLDQDGILHESRFVHFVIAVGHWAQN